jgi:hypothetical protein
MARRLKASAFDFALAVDSFIQYCRDTGTIPSDYMLMEHLQQRGIDISYSTLDRYYMAMHGNVDSLPEGDGTVRDMTVYKPYGAALKKLVSYREHMTIQQSIDNPKTAGHTAFRLKQARWGSWSDKQESSQDVAITVKLDFAGDKSKPKKGRK